MSGNLNLALPRLRDIDIVAEVASAIFDLDAIVQELLECGQVKDLVGNRLAAVDHVLRTPSIE